MQKQPSRGVLRKRCSENMQRIYRKTLMLKCDFNKVTKQLYWTHTSAWVFSCKFAAYFQYNFFLEHLWRAASEFGMVSLITSLYCSLNLILTTLQVSKLCKYGKLGKYEQRGRNLWICLRLLKSFENRAQFFYAV